MSAWLVLSAVAATIAARLSAVADGSDGPRIARTGAIIVAIYAVAFALGAFAGGFLVGRWGAPGVGTREAMLAGLVATAIAVVASWASYGVGAGPLLAAGVTVPSAALGGQLGRRRRARGHAS